MKVLNYGIDAGKSISGLQREYVIRCMQCTSMMCESGNSTYFTTPWCECTERAQVHVRHQWRKEPLWHIYLEKRSCQLFYYCVHMALPNDTAIQTRCLRSYVSFYVRCSVPGHGVWTRELRAPTIARQTFCCCLFGCACTRNFLLWNCFLHELFRIFRLLAWLISFRRCCDLLSRNITQ